MDVLNFFSSLMGGNIVTIILKLVLLVLGCVVAFFIYKWMDNKLKEEAHKKSQEGRSKDQTGLDQENKDIFDGAKGSESNIEDEIEKRAKK